MRPFLATSFILSLTLIAGGCATKKYVRNTTAPIQAKVDQVGDQANKQGQEIQESKQQIKQVDENAQSGISGAKELATTADAHAAAADSHAGAAMNKANQVASDLNDTNQKVSQTNAGLEQLRGVVSNLDDYKVTAETVITFRFNKYTLDNQAKEELDKVAQNLGTTKHYIISVEGFTDKSGTATYNQELSRKRADAVVEYLVAKHDIPVYRIHMVGLGKEKLADEGRGRAANAKNRRVEVKIFSNQQNPVSSQLNSSR